VAQLKAVVAGCTGCTGGPGGGSASTSDINSAVSQAKSYTDSRIDTLRNDIDKNRDDANGGTASAMAVATLPQPSAPGKNLLAFASSTFQGQTGLALGLSSMTNDGRWIVKAAATTNSRRQSGASVGAGYQW